VNRQLLRGVMVLGIILTLVGGTGIFAVFNDRATTAGNDVSSGQLPHAADLQIAMATIGDQNLDGIPDVVCDGFSDDMILPAGISAWFSLSDLQPGYLSTETDAMICLHNAGSSSLELTASAIDLTDADIACTGDEAMSGDLTCGLDAAMVPQGGELSPLISAHFLGMNCMDATVFGASGMNASAYLADLAVTPIAIDGGFQLAPGATACYSVQLAYPDPVSAIDAQLAQSDQVTWRFAFDGTVPSA